MGFKRRGKKADPSSGQSLSFEFLPELESVPVSPSLDENKERLEQLFADCSDLVLRDLKIGNDCRALLVFVDGLVDSASINEALKTIMVLEEPPCKPEQLHDSSLPVNQTQMADNFSKLLISVLGGDTGLLVDGSDRAILLGLRGMKTRSISEPETELVVRGPREGFVEHLRTNTSMLRRKIKSPHLKMKSVTVGSNTNTNVVITYMENIVQPDLLREVEDRLAKVNISAVMESGYLEEFVQDSTYSPFPQIQYTERPDTVASAILQGRVAILVDGTPFAMIAPTVFWHLMQASEDYYERFMISTLIRWLRFIFLVLSLLTPAVYIAVTTFHQDLLPTSLMLSIAAAREAIPFPALVEALIMEVTFEALREAGVRLPKAIGSAVSILGALVVGQAAVEAGIVSAPIVIVVSITGIASFTIPRFNGAIAIRMLRFPLMFAASIFGFYGIMLGVMVILGHMANLRSFGVPYLSPTSPMSAEDLKDVLVRAPWWSMERRPTYLHPQNQRRLSPAIHSELKEQGGQKGIRNEEQAGNKNTRKNNSDRSAGGKEGNEP
jgi:spore germination protein KA/spore germination protein